MPTATTGSAFPRARRSGVCSGPPRRVGRPSWQASSAARAPRRSCAGAAPGGRPRPPAPALGQEPPAGRCRQRGSCARPHARETLLAQERRALAHPSPGPFLGAAPARGGSASRAAAFGCQSLASRGLGARRPAGIRGARDASGLQRRRRAAALGAQLPGGLALAQARACVLRRGVSDANTAIRTAAQRVARPGSAAFWVCDATTGEAPASSAPRSLRSRRGGRGGSFDP